MNQLETKVALLEADTKRLDDLVRRQSEQNIIAQRTINMTIEKIKELGGLNHRELEEFFRERAKREYAYYKRHGKNPENFDEVIIDENNEEVKPMILMMDELQLATPNVQHSAFGVAGLGKSSFIRKFCKKHGIKCKNIRVSKASAKGFKSR